MKRIQIASYKDNELFDIVDLEFTTIKNGKPNGQIMFWLMEAINDNREVKIKTYEK